MTHIDDPLVWLAVLIAIAFFVAAGIVHVLVKEGR